MTDKPDKPEQEAQELHKTAKAVALQYDGEGAPRVTAKGSGYIADEIIRLAEEHEVPLQQDESLTEMLSTVELDHEIPENLYIAVAEVIAFAYRINNKKVSTPGDNKS